MNKITTEAEFCLPMKHHTMIFALATGVPTITNALDDYYFRTNQGALKMFGKEQCIVDSDCPFSSDILEKKIDDCLNNNQRIKKTILSYLTEMKIQDGEVIRRFIEEGARK